MILYCSSSFTACIIVEFVNHWVPVDRAFQKLGTQMILVFFLSRCVCIQHHANVDSKKHIKSRNHSRRSSFACIRLLQNNTTSVGPLTQESYLTVTHS